MRTGKPAEGKVSKSGLKRFSVEVAEDVYKVIMEQRVAMETELGRVTTIRDALETLVLAGYDNPKPTGGNTVVYSKSQGWTEKEDTAEDERGGWPFMAGQEGEMDIDRIIWDEDTGTWVVICN